jgi:hypothetical protein
VTARGRALGLLLALAAAACSDENVTGTSAQFADDRARTRSLLVAARQVWRVAGPRDYRFRFRQSCFCAPAVTAPVLLTVRGAEVVSAVYAEDGRTVAPSDLGRYPSVEELFTRVEQAIATEAYEIRASYDPRLGYPTSVFVDQSRTMADEEQRLEASDLVPWPVTLAEPRTR